MAMCQQCAKITTKQNKTKDVCFSFKKENKKKKKNLRFEPKRRKLRHWDGVIASQTFDSLGGDKRKSFLKPNRAKMMMMRQIAIATSYL